MRAHRWEAWQEVEVWEVLAGMTDLGWRWKEIRAERYRRRASLAPTPPSWLTPEPL
ncbi:MAG: hypothetical protein IPI35_35315 [Deltaproteobacteria bacterium]|nr:hypothetical protein [Deltaproteobacteria bacterium]